jgi:hypothetical protein
MNIYDLDTRKYFLAVGAFLAVLFALMGPEGTTDLGLLARLLQWIAQVAIPLLLLIGSHLLLSRISSFDRLNPWIKLTISGVVGSLLFAPIALSLDFIFGIDDWNQVQTTNQLLMLLLDEILGVLFPVTLVWIGINAPRVLGLDFSRSTENSADMLRQQPADEGLQAKDGFLNLLPGRIGTDVLYLMSELHYLRVVTTRGSALVLYNLSDAVSELAPNSGLQPHRSYWVALKHVNRLLKREGKNCLELSNGSQVPISRRRLSDVKAKIDPAPSTQQAVGPLIEEHGQ